MKGESARFVICQTKGSNCKTFCQRIFWRCGENKWESEHKLNTFLKMFWKWVNLPSKKLIRLLFIPVDFTRWILNWKQETPVFCGLLSNTKQISHSQNSWNWSHCAGNIFSFEKMREEWKSENLFTQLFHFYSTITFRLLLNGMRYLNGECF